MEINTQQLEALLQLKEQQAQLPRKNSARPEGFDALLAQKLDNGLETSQAFADPALTGAALYNPLMVENPENPDLDADMAVFEAAFAQASGALDLWDDYARVLGNANNSMGLKGAYSLLQGIDSQVAQLRTSPLAGNNAAFDEIINELEVLSVTEKFKFNRGDYQL